MDISNTIKKFGIWKSSHIDAYNYYKYIFINLEKNTLLFVQYNSSTFLTELISYFNFEKMVCVKKPICFKLTIGETIVRLARHLKNFFIYSKNYRIFTSERLR